MKPTTWAWLFRRASTLWRCGMPHGRPGGWSTSGSNCPPCRSCSWLPPTGPSIRRGCADEHLAGGTALVAERGITENLRSRTFKVITALLLLSSIAAVTIPQVLSGAGTTYTIATIGKAPVQVAAALDAAGKSADFTVRYVSRSDGPAVRRAVREDDATAGLAGGTLYTSATSAGTFPVVVAQTVVALETSRRLSEAGLSPRQVADLLSIRPPKQVIVGRADNAGRADGGFAVGIVLYLALLIAGRGIATTVAMEKSTRISEVLLAVLRPSQVLVGTVIAVGTVTLGQLLVLAPQP